MKNFLEKQKELLNQEEEIVNNQEARSTLLDLYRTRLNICRNKFNKTEAFSKLLSFKLNTSTAKLSKTEKDDVFEQILISYMETISDIVSETPDIKEKEILTILLRHLDFNNNQIACLFSITLAAVKRRITRLSQRVPSDFLNLFLKTHLKQ